jgi:hypothetical protein
MESIMIENPENPVPESLPSAGYSAPVPPPFQPVTPAAFQPVAAAYPPTPGMPPAAAPAPSQSGSSALKIILIVVGVLVVLVMLVVGVIGYGVWRVSRAVHLNRATGETTITTPNGTFSSNSSQKFTSDDLGTDIYPGATPARGGMRLTLPTGPMVSATFTTPDSKEKVIAFYKNRFGSQATTMDTDDGAILTVNKSKQDTVMMTITQKPGQADGKTRIRIVHTINHSAQ